MSRQRIVLKEPAKSERKTEVEMVAALLARLPYTTRLSIKYALDVQDHTPTDYTTDRATERLREALRVAGVADS